MEAVAGGRWSGLVQAVQVSELRRKPWGGGSCDGVRGEDGYHIKPAPSVTSKPRSKAAEMAPVHDRAHIRRWMTSCGHAGGARIGEERIIWRRQGLRGVGVGEIKMEN